MSQPTGLTLPVPPVVGIPWVSGVRYDGTAFFGGNRSTQAIVANTLYAMPCIAIHPSLRYGVPISLDRIGLDVTTGAAAGKKARVGLARMGADGKPGALIVDAGELAVDGIAGVEATISVTVFSGVPFFRLLVSDGTPTLRNENAVGFRSGLNALVDTSGRFGYSVALTYTAGSTVLPDPAAQSWAQIGLTPSIILRVA